ncbi:ricin B lectin domain-containing protein [Pterulicium gracile]|uniref:Ricin B lectin domain-containing protein n=1 Tax=Pterulicium gracile TaxID=1884261 RepID=A0A5C3Q946_9AGAR|nr:ricin B lectin domain-containing protein [Pterula gracilis]
MFNRTLLLAFVSLCVSSSALAQGPFLNVTNNCPISVPLYAAGELKTTLTTVSANPSKSFTLFNDTTLMGGYFYTDANQGNKDGNGAVRVSFKENDHYYLVKDPSWINVGVSVTPNGRAPEPSGFCSPARCEFNACPDTAAFPQYAPSTSAPPSGNAPPQLPYHRCPGLGNAKGYTITFCPSGTLPNLQTGPNTITLAGNSNKCLDVRGGVVANGTPVQITTCTGAASQKWVIRRGKGQIKLSGTNFCLDATDPNPANGTGLKIWQCYDDLIAQRWFYDGVTKEIWLNNDNDEVGGGGCVDLADGNTTNGRQVQMWSCGGGNPNQKWNI